MKNLLTDAALSAIAASIDALPAGERGAALVKFQYELEQTQAVVAGMERIDALAKGDEAEDLRKAAMSRLKGLGQVGAAVLSSIGNAGGNVGAKVGEAAFRANKGAVRGAYKSGRAQGVAAAKTKADAFGARQPSMSAPAAAAESKRRNSMFNAGLGGSLDRKGFDAALDTAAAKQRSAAEFARTKKGAGVGMGRASVNAAAGAAARKGRTIGSRVAYGLAGAGAAGAGYGAMRQRNQ